MFFRRLPDAWQKSCSGIGPTRQPEKNGYRPAWKVQRLWTHAKKKRRIMDAAFI
jgi:hypothetical protein